MCLSCFDRLTKEQIGGASSKNANVAASVLTPDDILKIPDDDAIIRDNHHQEVAILHPENADEAIRKRLQVLKDARLSECNNAVAQQSTPLSDSDIAIRIANLKDQKYIGAEHRDASILLDTDRRTDQEKMHDLLEQFAAEAKLDEDADPVKDIERRLAALRAGGNKDSSNQRHDADHKELGDTDQVKQLVARYMAEAALDDAADERELELTSEEKEFVEQSAAKKADQKKSDGDNEEELPWCVICNEDAELRYQGDLFCRSCYKEVREDDLD